MSPTERLKEDHAVLRAKAEVVKTSLHHTQGGVRDGELQERCAALLKMLRDHLNREERVVALCSLTLGTFQAEELARFAIEHRVESKYFKLINRLLRKTSEASQAWVQRMFTTALSDLTRHMDEQETTLFPLLERVLEPQVVTVRQEMGPMQQDKSGTTGRFLSSERCESRGVDYTI